MRFTGILLVPAPGARDRLHGFRYLHLVQILGAHQDGIRIGDFARNLIRFARKMLQPDRRDVVDREDTKRSSHGDSQNHA
jgi:hypothetical protein